MGCNIIVELVDATQEMGGVGVWGCGGVGCNLGNRWVVISLLNLHTWLMLLKSGGVGCNIIVEHAHMVDSRRQMGCNIIVELAYMVDATQEMGGAGV